jgi:uncharacterized membrane protein
MWKGLLAVIAMVLVGSVGAFGQQLNVAHAVNTAT